MREPYPTEPIVWQLLVGGGVRQDVPQPTRTVTSFIGSSAASTAFQQLLNTGTTGAGPQLAITFLRNSHSPILQTATGSIEQEVSNFLELKVQYLYGHETGLLQVRNVNLPPPTFINGRADFANGTLFPSFAQVYQYSTHNGRVLHRGAASATVRKEKYFFGAIYTLSKVIDDVVPLSFEDTAQNPFDISEDRAFASLATRHTLDLMANWNVPELLPQTTSKNLIFLNNFNVSGSFHFNSGRYFNVLSGSDFNHDGNPLTDRPLGVSRNTFLGKQFAQLNLGIGSKVLDREGKSLRLSVECSNLFNRANFQNFQTVIGLGNLTTVNPKIVFGRAELPDLTFRQPIGPNGFGLATSAATPRRFEGRLRFSF